MSRSIASPLKWHGGKHYLAKRIVALMPPHTYYVEPYAGGLSVLLAKDPSGISEVVNDIDGDLIDFWRCLRQENTFAEFKRFVDAVPFSERDWRDARRIGISREYDAVPGTVRAAVAFFICCRQSLAGRMDTFATLSRTRTRRGMNEQASAWLSTVEGLPEVHARLSRVVILDQPALKVIASEDGPDTLFYLDPPYLPATRTATDVYRHEMSEDDHRELLAIILTLRGKVMLSGYHSGLYDATLAGWRCHEFTLPNHAAGGRRKKRMTEVVWCNFS